MECNKNLGYSFVLFHFVLTGDVEDDVELLEAEVWSLGIVRPQRLVYMILENMNIEQ